MEMVCLDCNWEAIHFSSAQHRDLSDPSSPNGQASGENLATKFWQTAAARGSHPAVEWQGVSISYDKIRAAALIVCDYIRCLPKFRPGAMVALALENSPEYLAAFYGIQLADGVVVPIPSRVERERWRFIQQSCSPTIVLTRREDSPAAICETADRCVVLPIGTTPRPSKLDNSGLGFRVHRGARDLAMILFTSGSTGAPKGVMLSHRNLLSNARSILGFLPIREDDRALVVLPFCHAFGNSILQTHLLAGATLILGCSLVVPSSIVKSLREHRATSFSGVPEVFTPLWRFASWHRGDLPHLRYMSVAGGAMNPELVEQVCESIAPAEFYVMYGQSEGTARLSYLHPPDRPSRPGSIGKGIPDVELRVVDARGQLARADEIGMLQARGDNVMLGYWQDPQGTAEVLQNGWLSTGDLAAVDADGFIFLRGRASDLLKLQGHRVHPAEIENLVARSFPGSQVIVIPDEVRDLTRLAMFCVPPPGVSLTQEDVMEVCLRELPHYKIPHRVEVLERLRSMT